MARVFFALQPPPSERAAIKTATRNLASGDPVHTEDLHFTLCFLGEVGPDQIAALGEAAASLPTAEWPCTLTTIEHWARPRLLCLLPEEGPDTRALAGLAERLRALALDIGLKPDARAFRPHLTVMRKVPAGRAGFPRLLASPIRVHPRGFLLMQSQAGQSPRYRPLHTWTPANPIISR